NECAGGLCRAGYSAGSEKEPLGICEKSERGRAEGISRDHVQRLFLNWICQRDGDPVLNQSRVGIEPLKLRAFTLQAANNRICSISLWLSSGSIHINRRSIIGVDGKDGCVSQLGQDHAAQVGVDLTHTMVVARSCHAVAASRRWVVTDKVIALIHGEHKQGVAFGDSIRSKPIKELLERAVVGCELLCVTCFARTKPDADVAG